MTPEDIEEKYKLWLEGEPLETLIGDRKVTMHFVKETADRGPKIEYRNGNRLITETEFTWPTLEQSMRAIHFTFRCGLHHGGFAPL